jgi:hypothetical protein
MIELKLDGGKPIPYFHVLVGECFLVDVFGKSQV